MDPIVIPIINSDAGPGTLTVTPGATTFSLSFKLTNGGIYFANDLKVDWSPEVLAQFVTEVSNPNNWIPTSIIPPIFDNMPVAVVRKSDTELQIRVGYDKTPSSLIFNGIITLDTSKVGVVDSPHPRSDLLEVGKLITLVPSNFKGMRVGHFAFGLINRPFENTDQLKRDCTFMVEKGLMGDDKGYISFRSLNFPGQYVNHYAFLLNLSAKGDSIPYKQNASFFPAVGSAGATTVTLYSLNFPKKVWRHSLHRLVISDKENTPLFTADSSFNVIPGLATQ
jgi:hypothetical protein